MPQHRCPGQAFRERRRMAAFVVCGLLLCLSAIDLRAQHPKPAISVTMGADGRLAYAADHRGNRIIDFSHAGYGAGIRTIPDVPARILVNPGPGDDGERIQAAIDTVSARPLDADGHRGAVVLAAGEYTVEGSLRISASGVVLRGSGAEADGSVVVASGQSRRSLIVVTGDGSRAEIAGSGRRVTDTHVPAGARTLTVDDAAGFAAGQRVVVRRPSTAEWIAALGMNLFPGWRPENRLHWQPGSRDIVWDRVIESVDGARITLDAPITTAIEHQLGGGTVARYQFPGRIAEVGVENLRLVSAYDPALPLDEDHAWTAVTVDKAEHVWVRHVEARHFSGSAVIVEAEAKWVTVSDVGAAAPVSELGGYRRRTFYAGGQLTLFHRCRSEHGLHDFVTGFTAAGPNVFLACTARNAHGFSGPLESWASGVLYDSVVIRGDALRLTDRGVADQGQGWAAANSVLWNCEATDVEVQSPPGAVNQAYGCKGVVTGDGIVWDPRTMPFRDFYRGTPVEPASLYRAQLVERGGPAAARVLEPRAVPTGTTGARPLTAADISTRQDQERPGRAGPRPGALQVEGGRFTIDGQPAWTARTSYSWFQAQMPRSLAPGFGPAITRFAPGKTGTGWTDDLEAVAAAMAPRSTFYQHFGLWYDRRRVDHNYYGSPEQRTGDVWAPFMELPWARSGTGNAWDGLSRYDLTRFNRWYFDRIKAFAEIADRRGLVLYNHFYFQHWLLESRSHYVDFPWRPVNTIQDTGLPDEVPAANVFYDVSHPVRRDLHRRYIRHVLDTLAGHTNVVFGIDREYTGPLSFVQFWLDTIAEWQREHGGRRLFIALEVPKDQMDAILADPVRGPMITAIDVLGWVYRADGRLYAARGSLNRAPREQRPDIATQEELTELKAKLGISALDQKDFLNGPEFQRLFDTLWVGSKPMKYRAWREYRDAHPQVVTLWSGDEYPALTTAVERDIPADVRARTRPVDVVEVPRESAWCTARTGLDYVVYSVEGRSVTLDLSGASGAFTLTWVNGQTASTTAAATVQGGRVVTLDPPEAGKPWVAWLSRRDQNPARGVAVQWTLDNIETLGGLPVTAVGTPAVVASPHGPALAFNGATDGVFVDVNPLQGLGRFTIEAVIEPAVGGPAEQRFFHAQEADADVRALLELRLDPDGTWCLDTFLKRGPAALTLIDRGKRHAAGAWHTVALVYDGVTMAHYVNGEREAEGSVAFGSTGPGRTSIGVRQNRVSWFKGAIRMVRITPEVVPPERMLRVR